MQSGSITKILIMTVVVIYCLTPYIMKRINDGCTCGCQEYICQCCRNAEDFVDGTPVMECGENACDESYEQSPSMTVPIFQLAVTLDLLGEASSSRDDSALAGYQVPPMKPPPSV